MYGTVTLCGAAFQPTSIIRQLCNSFEKPYNPERKIPSVWALPLSLAATDGIDFSFFSYRYLDVSVPCVLDKHL